MILQSGSLEHMFFCQNPFVFAVHHDDHFPAGDGQLQPVERRVFRPDGDMDPKAPWRMYYGERVPGFPAHPHRGFETVTAVVRGTVDHTDGLGSRGRYEDGDVQWMTAGRGLQHAEMFPLKRTDGPNHLELFQIWLSLDSAHRMAEPAYKMLWQEDIPVVTLTDENGLSTKVTVIAGEEAGQSAPLPTPDSWAADPKNRLQIKLYALEPGAAAVLPRGTETMNRSLYFYDGDALRIDGKRFADKSYAFVRADAELILKNEGSETARVLLLEAEPIPEPIVARGPFVMSSEEEIREAFKDYRETQFGGWPFAEDEVYHAPEQVRFAEYPDGTVEYPAKEK